MQNVVLPPLELDYQDVYGMRTKVRVMDIREIAAEKIRAMSDRVRYRDFYDFVMIVKKLSINLNEVLALVSRKEIRKEISKKNILGNWILAQQEKTEDLAGIAYSEDLENGEIKSELEKLNFDIIKN